MAVALLVAAGRGERLGTAEPKAFVMLAGRPMVQWSIEALAAVDEVERIVVALPPGVHAPAGTVGVPGGEQRSHSVRAALRAAGEAAVVLVHDAARPAVTPQIVRDCLDTLAAHDCDAAVAATPVTDTIKESRGAEVVRTLDRARLWAAQTPQVFNRDALERALSGAESELAAATDDASLLEAAGGTVRLVPAPRDNLKVTTPLDLRLAELLLAERAATR
jgi:2-C-methyl-D-erythritol 4-phosphate cytidylyltransferase